MFTEKCSLIGINMEYEKRVMTDLPINLGKFKCLITEGWNHQELLLGAGRLQSVFWHTNAQNSEPWR